MHRLMLQLAGPLVPAWELAVELAVIFVVAQALELQRQVLQLAEQVLRVLALPVPRA